MGLLGKIWVKLGLDSSEFKKGIKGAQTESNVFAQGFKKIGGMIAGAFAIESIVRFGKELLDLRDKSKGIEGAFKALNKPTLLSELRAATGGAVSDLKLMQNAVKANNFKIPMEELATYMKFASQRALETGESVDYLVESIILGLSRESVMILDNLGLSAVGIRKEMENGGTMAKAVGKMIQEEFKKSNTVLDESISKSAKLAASWENFKKMVAQGFVGEAVSGFGVMLQGQMDAFSWLFGGKQKAKTELFNKEDNERAKKWLSNIKDINHAKFELLKLDGKVLSTAETMYVQMLKEYVQKEENAALQKKISAETIDGTNKEIEGFEILKKAELDTEKRQYYVDEIALLNEKLSIMEMTTDELKKQRKEQEIAATKKELRALKVTWGFELDEVSRAFLFEQIAAKSLYLEGLESEEELNTGLLAQKEREIALLEDMKKWVGDTQPELLKWLGEEINSRKKNLELIQKTNAELLREKYKVIPEVSKTPSALSPYNFDLGKGEMDKALKNRIAFNQKNNKLNDDSVNNMKDTIGEVEELNRRFNDAIVFGISDSLQTLVDQIVETGKVDAASVAAALVSPFGDMLIQLGEVALMSAIGIEAIKDSFSSMNPALAAAAGVALIALGSLVKAGVAQIGKSGGKSSGMSNTSFTGGSYIPQPAVASANGNDVMAVIKGEDIWLINKKVDNRKGR